MGTITQQPEHGAEENRMTCKLPISIVRLTAALVVGGGLLSGLSARAQTNVNFRRPGLLPSKQQTQRQNAGLTSQTSSYTYTLFDFPGSLSSLPLGTAVSGKSSKIEAVGCYGAAANAGTSFLMHYTAGKTATTESYQEIVVPGSANDDCADGVNKAGTIVGEYTDSSNVTHGWELSGTTFSTINVPFQGAIDTYPEGINDSGEVVGGWDGGSAIGGGFTLINGTYTSITYPGTGPNSTEVFAVNNKGDLGGYYEDSSGIYHGMLDIGGVFSTIDPPGSIETTIQGLDDNDNAAGWFCTTTECEHNLVGAQGFLYSGGNFTIYNFPGANATALVGINHAGVLLGTYIDVAGNYHGFLATP